MSFDQFSQFLNSMSGPTNPIPTVMPTVPVDRYSTHATKDEARKPSPCVMSQLDSMARKLRGQSAREVLTSSAGRPCIFSSPLTFDGSVWVRAQGASSKGTLSSVPAWF